MNTTPSKSSAWEQDIPNFSSISPLDGRNYHKIAGLSEYFSELALNKKRLYVELTYLIYLAKIEIAPPLTNKQQTQLLDIHDQFGQQQMKRVREIEHTTNHDVKAVEYFVKEQLEQLNLTAHVEFVHWALASEDVNNLAYSLLLQKFHYEQLLPLIEKALDTLVDLIEKSDYPMLGRTHGQPASVTVMAKELAVYLERFQITLKKLGQVKFYGKISGATGAYVDQLALDTTIDWPQRNAQYISSLSLEPVLITTQILPYEYIAEYFAELALLQETAIDFCQNLWWYVSYEYFKQALIKTETGSSIMPHKINPIYLEGGEGGFQMSNAFLNLYVQKFTHSRLQRDLSDATVRRSFGIAFGYSYLSWQSLIEALDRLTPNPTALQQDLDAHWEIMAEPIQNYLRTQGFDHPYELMKDKVRGRTLSKSDMHALIESLPIDDSDKQYLKKMTPASLATTASALASQAVSAYRQTTERSS